MPQAGGWYEIPHRTENEVFRAVLAVTPVEDWQEVCDLAMTKINCTSSDGAPSPYLLWFGREPSVLADRLLSVAYYPVRREPEGETGVVDNAGATIRSMLAEELNVRRAKLQQLNMLWEDRFIAARERAAAEVVCKPVAVGDWVRTAELVSGKLDTRWSERKRVRRVRGNVVFVDGEVRAYYASQVKRVPRVGDSGVPTVEAGGGMESPVGIPEVGEESVETPVVPSMRQQVVRRKRPRVSGEEAYLLSLQQPRAGKRAIRPTAKARAAGGGSWGEGRGDG